ncbi:heterodisulfide reductase-related iron-sulfur binding cluster [Campylobacter sp. RM16192]|uniref:heterodisulfide reductase-related iron-sulfur binding cluster n=1 Tax=Campylobacter sp. RM16192 TaxID=1660080 RepID=UPI0014529783|nr:heterodisulfide reductase-related iron-sulfur binding cluster [Campylobacter sp. RM16192]QCD53139.1 Fe-S oxidoreductase [Campylobacter sp. RM16192]
MRSQKNTKNPPELCIDCSACTKHCEFLEKYDINLLDFSKRDDLAYNCFLCDKCYAVCPKDISGNEIALNLRAKNPKPFKYLKFLKSPYIYANNSLKKSRELMFFGCNFPAFLPRTTRKIIEIFEPLGIDFSIDCCGKPLFETTTKFEDTKDHLNKLFEQKEVETLILACPNCYHFLKDKVDIKLKTIYEKFEELGLNRTIEEEAHMFYPCPERIEKPIFESFKKYLPNVKNSFKNVNCCGLGGLAKSNEKSIANGYCQMIKDEQTPNVYTYCATCSGNFQRNGIKNIKHIATVMAGVNETPSTNYVANALSLKFYKRGRK